MALIRVKARDFRAKGFDLYLLTKCTRLCDFCYLTEEQLARYKGRMGMELIRRIVAWAFTEGSPFEKVTLLGGEPAAHPRAAQIIRYLGSVRRFNGELIQVRIVTNGSKQFRKLLLDPTVVEVLRRGFVNVSLESIDLDVNDDMRGRGAYRDALETIAMLRERGIPFGINTTLQTRNLGGLVELFDFAGQVGAERVNLHWWSPAGNGLNQPEMYKLTREQWSAVVRLVAQYRRQHHGRRIDCQLGYSKGEFPGEDLNMCAVRDMSNLQFYPPRNERRVVCLAGSCGRLAEDPERSGYLFRASTLHKRINTWYKLCDPDPWTGGPLTEREVRKGFVIIRGRVYRRMHGHPGQRTEHDLVNIYPRDQPGYGCPIGKWHASEFEYNQGPTLCIYDRLGQREPAEV